jgi:hypothetical protein
MVADRYGRAMAIAALVITGGWHFGHDLPVMIAGWHQYQPAWVIAVVWCGYTLIGVVSAVAVLRGQRWHPEWPALALPTLVGLTVLSHVVNQAGSEFADANWAWQAVCWFALLVLWFRRLAGLVVFCAVNGVVGGVFMAAGDHADRVEVARFILTVYGISVLPVIVNVGSRMLAATARRAAADVNAQARLDTARLAAEAVHQSRGIRFRSARQASAQLLADIASGALDLDSPQTQAMCRVAAARLRRLIAETDEVPDPLIHELRACADTAERRGVAVDLAPIGTIPPLPVEVRRALTDLPIEVLAGARTQARITVVAAPDDVAVAVVADEGVPHPARDSTVGVTANGVRELVTASFDRAGGQVWVQTRWRAR